MQTPPDADPPDTESPDAGGRYASYRNAFLLKFLSSFPPEKLVVMNWTQAKNQIQKRVERRKNLLNNFGIFVYWSSLSKKKDLSLIIEQYNKFNTNGP